MRSIMKQYKSKMETEWKSVKRDGLPTPSGDKAYFVVYNSGYGYGSYQYEDEFVGYENMEINGKILKVPKHIKTDKARWMLDFDGFGHEDEITDYFEITFPWD
jgi:hypothetical protein